MVSGGFRSFHVLVTTISKLVLCGYLKLIVGVGHLWSYLLLLARIYVASKIPKDWPQGKSEPLFLGDPPTRHKGCGLYHEHLPIIGQNVSRDLLHDCYLPMASLLSCGILRVRALVLAKKPRVSASGEAKRQGNRPFRQGGLLSHYRPRDIL